MFGKINKTEKKSSTSLKPYNLFLKLTQFQFNGMWPPWCLIARMFTDLIAWVGFCPPPPKKNPSPGCTFQYRYFGMRSINISSKISNAYVLVHLWYRSKLLPRTLRNISVRVKFHPWSPYQGVIFELLSRVGWRGWVIHSLNNSCKIDTGKVLAHLWLKWKVLSGPMNNLIAWMGFCTWSPEQDVKLHTLILKGMTLLISQRQSSSSLLYLIKKTSWHKLKHCSFHCSFVVHLKFVCHLTILLYICPLAK
jgi:hypothetical protein